MSTRTRSESKRHAVWWCFLVLTLAALSVQPAAGASLSISNPQLAIGKVDPGHQAEFERTVANTGDAQVNVQIDVVCPCTPHLTVSPQTFSLAPGESRSVTMTLEVPADAEPGVHDVRVKVIEKVVAGAGGTGQSAIDIVANYQVRTMGLYADPAVDALDVSARVVNAFVEGLDVEVTGWLGTDPPRSVEHVSLHAEGSEAGSRVTRFHVEVPLTDADPDGVYTLYLEAAWRNDTAGITPGTATLEVPVGWGVPLPGTAPADDPSLNQDDGTTGGASGQPGASEEDDESKGPGFKVSGTWLLVGAALVGGIVAGVWLGRRKT